jgi:uncharacterized membrane protein YgcG
MLMGQFVVNNGPDRVQFWKLKNKYRTFRGGQAECHISRKQPKHHVHQVDQNLLTVERVLQVSNDWCYNLIVDKCRIETVTLFEDEAEAEQQIFLRRDGQHTMPNGVTCARLPNGVVKTVRNGMKSRIDGRGIFHDMFGGISELGNIPQGGSCLGASRQDPWVTPRQGGCKCKRCDKGLLLADMAENGQALVFASEELKGDREVVLAAVAQNWWALKFASKELKGDRDVMLAAVAQNGWAFQFASKELKGDREVVSAAVAQDRWALQFASEELKGDRDVVLAAVAQNWWALKFASKELKGDRDVMLAAVAQNGWALQFASEELKGDREVVLAAVAQHGKALQFASEELKGAPRGVVLAAVAQDGYALQYASEELKGDRDVMLAAVAQGGCALKYASGELKGDRDVVLAAVAQDGFALQYASEELSKDLLFVSSAFPKANTSRLQKAEAELVEARAEIAVMEDQLAVEVIDVESGETARTKGVKRGREEGGDDGGSGGSGSGGSGGSGGSSSNIAMQTMVVQGAQLKKVKQEKMQVENNYDDRMLCIACQDSEREVLFLPCSHVGMCAGCAASVSECPTCRGRIDSKRNIRLV